MNKKVGILLLLLVLLAYPVLSETAGCFLDKESSLYCQELTFEEATEECTLFSHCEVEEVFKENVGCSSLQECDSGELISEEITQIITKAKDKPGFMERNLFLINVILIITLIILITIEIVIFIKHIYPKYIAPRFKK